MRPCKSGKPHDPKVFMDDAVSEECGMNEVWTPDGVKTAWLCGHHLRCNRCGRVMVENVLCPDNKRRETQIRRWR